MTNLRKAAEMALEVLEEVEQVYGSPSEWFEERLQALRQALTQSDDEALLKQGWRQCAVGQRTTQYCGMAEQARLEEREACAKVCDDWAKKSYLSEAKWCAALIRARGQA